MEGLEAILSSHGSEMGTGEDLLLEWIGLAMESIFSNDENVYECLAFLLLLAADRATMEDDKG